jgi:hypothetical protein
MLQHYTALLEDHANLKNDYASERDIRRNYQKHVDSMQRQVADTRRELVSCPPAALWHPSILTTLQENNSFVLALIDGDGVIVSLFHHNP